MVGRRIAAIGGLAATVVLLASCLSVLVARSVNAPALPQAQIGLPAPVFALPDLDGELNRLDAYRGKVVVLAFIDTRCPMTNAYRPRVNALAEQYADRDDVVFIKVASEPSGENSARLRELRIQRQVLGHKLPTLLDWGANVARQYGVAVTPTFCVIDQYGALRYIGAFDDNQDPAKVTHRWCAEAVERLLRREAVLVRETEAFGCRLGG